MKNDHDTYIEINKEKYTIQDIIINENIYLYSQKNNIGNLHLFVVPLRFSIINKIEKKNLYYYIKIKLYDTKIKFVETENHIPIDKIDMSEFKDSVIDKYIDFLIDGKKYAEIFSSLKKYCFLINYDKQYRDIKVIYNGKKSTVKIVENIISGNKYISKISYKDKIEKNYNFIKSAKNEIYMLSILNHKNIVNFIEAYNDNDKIVLIMEYIDGYTLYDKIKFYQYNENELSHIISEILNGLIYIHKKKILHRDIKLTNIMINNDNNIKIIDFNSAEFIDYLNEKSIKTGTPGYIAPEIFNSKIYTFKSDIFSLGIIFYTMLFNTFPFHGRSEYEIFRNNECMKIDYHTIYKNNKISLEAIDLLKKMIDTNVETRFYTDQILQHTWMVDNLCSPKLKYTKCINQNESNDILTNMLNIKSFKSISCDTISINEENTTKNKSSTTIIIHKKRHKLYDYETVPLTIYPYLNMLNLKFINYKFIKYVNKK